RAQLGLEPDEDDRLTDRSAHASSEPPVRWSLAWFPRDQIAAALARWPSLSDDLHDPDSYCRVIEAKLQTIRMATGTRPTVAPVRVANLVSTADEYGLRRRPDRGSVGGGTRPP